MAGAGTTNHTLTHLPGGVAEGLTVFYKTGILTQPGCPFCLRRWPHRFLWR